MPWDGAQILDTTKKYNCLAIFVIFLTEHPSLFGRKFTQFRAIRFKFAKIWKFFVFLFFFLIVITFYLPFRFGQETAKEPFGLRVKLPPVHLSTTDREREVCLFLFRKASSF